MTTTKHPRTITRQAVVGLLTGATSAGDAVKASRKNPWRELLIPEGGIVVYTQDEKVDEKSTTSAPTNLERHIELVIVIGVGINESAQTAADDAVDAIARQVEVLMERSESLGFDTNADAAAIGMKLKNFFPLGTETDLSEDGRKPTSFAVLRYRVIVWDQMLDANTDPLDDLVTVDVKTNLGGVQEADEVTEDIVTLQT